MNYIEKLKCGLPISKVFKSTRTTPYRHLFIVSACKKEALLHHSDSSTTFVSDWYDHIDDFSNYVYTKVYLSNKYNYIYSSGELVSPYWSDEMRTRGVTLWPIAFNGKYNFIKEDGGLLLNSYADGIWVDGDNQGSFIIKETDDCKNCFHSKNYYSRLNDNGEQELIDGTKYDNIPIVDVYSSKNELSERLILHRRLFSISIEDINGKEIVSDFARLITYSDRPISDMKGISEGNHGSLFSVRKVELADREELLLSYDFATVQCEDGFRVLCFSTETLLPDTFEEVVVLRALFIKVRKNSLWNVIDKYGDYVSKVDWFDEIELLNNGNAIVKKGEQYNFLKSNGILLFSEWFDKIENSSENDKYIVRRGCMYNVIDSNLRFASSKWQDAIEGLPFAAESKCVSTHLRHKHWSNIQIYDPVWIKKNGLIIECYVLAQETNKLTLLWKDGEGGNFEAKVVSIYNCGYDCAQTSLGTVYCNRPK